MRGSCWMSLGRVELVEVMLTGEEESVRRDGSCWSPAFMVAAACRETDAERGEPEGDSGRGIGGLSPLVAMAGDRVVSLRKTRRLQ